jgi:phytoene dehydrogenase-like protein
MNPPETAPPQTTTAAAAPRTTPHPTKPLDYDALIIGAGMSGIAAGIRLALHGKRVLILERHTAAGGLNSYYQRAGHRFDTALHAVTNYTPPGTKGGPLHKILRQLRLSRDDFALAPQLGSAIHFAGKRVRFDNNFARLESEIAREFPAQIDAFRRLNRDLLAIPDTALDTPPDSARAFVAERLSDPLLADLLFLPLSFYGSARENDMDLPQFAIIWKSLFHEGFARPREGVRQILRALLGKYRQLGGQLRLGCGVKRLEIRNGRVAAAILDNGEQLSAEKILSCAGAPETLRLCENTDANANAANAANAVAGANADANAVALADTDGDAAAAADRLATPPARTLAFCEGISVFREQPRDFGWRDTIIFFCDSERFHYAAADALTDLRSGVICLPNNYDYDGLDGAGDLPEGCLRVSALAGYGAWRTLREKSPTTYAAAKRDSHAHLNAIALRHLHRTTTEPPPAPTHTTYKTYTSYTSYKTYTSYPCRPTDTPTASPTATISAAAAPAATISAATASASAPTAAAAGISSSPDAPLPFTLSAEDFFTPLTIERFTGRIGGAIYGTPQKHRDGRTPFSNLFLCGADQGFLGITGALLSGISIANLHFFS